MSRDPHLGDNVAALVDGVLGNDAREKALSHLTRCAHCRGEVDDHRMLKARLNHLGPPALPLGLTQRLRELPDAPPDSDPIGMPPVRVEARFRSPPAAVRAVAPRRVSPPGKPASGRPANIDIARPGRSRPSRRRVAATAAGGLAAFAITLVTVVAVGGGDQPAPITPPVNTFTVEHSRVTSGVPGADTEAGPVDAVNGGR